MRNNNKAPLGLRVCVRAQLLCRVRPFSDPIDCSPPDSSVHGIFQSRVLVWGAIAFSTEWEETFANHTSGKGFVSR